MGDGCKKKINTPQLEDGYTRVANELLEAVFQLDFNGAQIRVLLCLIRNTYGFGRKECDFSNSFAAKGTGLNKKSVAAVIKSLQEGKVIAVTQQSTYSNPRKVKLNKHIKEWSAIPPQWKTSPTGVDVPTGTGEDVPTGTGEDVPTQKRKNLNKDLKKDIVKKPPYREIIDYLNEKTGKSYRWQGKATQSHINARFADGYTLGDFKKVIDNKTTEWKGGKWEKYLRPETLFGNKFEGYLNQPRGKEEKDGALRGRTGTNEKGFAEEAIAAGVSTECEGIFDNFD